MCTRLKRNYSCRDVVTAPAQPDHRKLKFGLRHGIKLIYLYAMASPNFDFRWFGWAGAITTSLTRIQSRPCTPFLIENGHKLISPSKKIDLNLILPAYWIILRDASPEPILKSHSLLFILASYMLPQSTVHGTKFSPKAINLILDLSGG